MFVTMNPQLDLMDEIVRILGWPAVVTTLVWVVRKWDAGQQAVKDLTDNTALAVQKVSKVDEELTLIKSNHLQHLQSGIDQLAVSNDKAVAVLEKINSGIGLLVDRTSRT